MVTATDTVVVWTDHARSRWSERFGNEQSPPEVNGAIAEQAIRAGFRIVKVIDGPATMVLNLAHQTKAVVCTCYPTRKYEYRPDAQQGRART